MPRRLILVLALPALLALGWLATATATDPTYSGTAVKSVTATLVDSTGAAIGTVQLHQDAAGAVLVRVDAAGLPAGPHGMHVHTTGKCEGPAFTSAGGHFNPAAKKHGLDAADGPHAGDLVQISASFTGTGTVTATTDRISLTGGATNIFDADGAALVIHASADDQVTDATGNSGARIACAVVAAPQPAAPATTTAAPAPPATGTGLASDSGNDALYIAIVGGVMATLAGAALAVRRRGTTP